MNENDWRGISKREWMERAEAAEAGVPLGVLQANVARMYQERGYTSDLMTLGLILTGEVGEVAHAINDGNRLYVAKPGHAEHSLCTELGHALVALCAIANSAGINLVDCLPEHLRGS